MKISEMTADQIRHMALKLNDSGKMPLAKMEPIQALRAGNFWAWVAKTEECKKFWRAAKADLRQRELNGTSYPGDAGHVTIGGRRFTFYPKSGMIVRDDFAVWAEANFDRFVRPCGGPKTEDGEPESGERIGRVDNWHTLWKRVLSMLKGIKANALMKKGEWNSEWDMRTFMTRYAMEIAKDDARGEYYTVSHIQADMLKGNIAYVKKDFRTAVEAYLSAAAACIATARYIQVENYDEEACEDDCE